MRIVLTSIIVFFLLPCCNFTLAAQLTLEKDSSKFNSLMLGADYSSNTSTFGRFSSLSQQPSYSAYASYYSQYGFSLGLSSVAIANSDSFATNFSYEYDLNLGYDYLLGKYFTASTTYNHFFYSSNSNSLKSLYTDEFYLGLKYNSKRMFGSIGGYYLMGDYNEWMNDAHAGLNFEIKNVFFRNHSIAISPEIGTILSNQKYYNQYAYQNYWYLFRTAVQYPELTVGELRNSPGKYPLNWYLLRRKPQIWKNFKDLDQDLVISELFTAKSKFNFSSVSFTLPIYYNVGNFSINLSYTVSVPLNIPEYMDQTALSYFSAGIYYSFIL